MVKKFLHAHRVKTGTNEHLLISNTKLMLINKNLALQQIRIIWSSFYLVSSLVQ